MRIEFLEKLIKEISPSGYEDAVAHIWAQNTKESVGEIKVDVNGNVIAKICGTIDKRIMFTAHIDEVGYMIKYIDDNGYLYFSSVGGVDRHVIPGTRLKIRTDSGDILGVVGRKATHLQTTKEGNTVDKFVDMWIDIGAKNKSHAEAKVCIGDIGVPDVGFERLGADTFVGRAFDDKAGAFVISEVLRRIDKVEQAMPTVYGVATVQEEIGIRGAITSAYAINPDIGIALDVTFATDHPGANKKQVGDIKLGGGPVIARGPNIHPEVFRLLVATANHNDIPYQIEACRGVTGTDASAIQVTRSGIATGLISLPLRYMHTPVEVINNSDLENTINLLVEFSKSMKDDMPYLGTEDLTI